MAYVITTDVFCDGDNCACWVWGYTGPRPNYREAAKSAESQGWRKVKTANGTFKMFCPACTRIARGLDK